MKVKLILLKITDKNCKNIADRLYDFTEFCVNELYPIHSQNDTDPIVITDEDYIFVVKAGHVFWNGGILLKCLEEKTTKFSDEPVVGDENWFLIDCKKIDEKIFDIEKHNIKPFSRSVQLQKKYSFPKQMYSHIEKLMADLSSSVPTKLKPFAKELRAAYENLEMGYYVINTETINTTKTFTSKFDNYLGVCGGLKTYILLGQDYFSENTNVLLFDISPAAIKWQQFLRKMWNGEIEYFIPLARVFNKLNPNLYPILPYTRDGITRTGKKEEKILHEFLSENDISAQQLKKGWNKFQKMNVEYKKIDLFNSNDVEKLVRYTKLGTNTYFWISNCFVMERHRFQFGKTIAPEEEFIKKFRDNSHTPCTFDAGIKIYTGPKL